MLIETSKADPRYHRDLGDGLVLRWSTREDTEEIAYLLSMVFRHSAERPPNASLVLYVHEMMSGNHPLISPGDFALVEDTRRKEHPIIACTCLWRQQWEYEGIAFGVGRPEFVATDPDYRNRGLIRAIFELLHARSAAEGHLVQAITGIPYFYRQFGYEYALDLGGSRTTYLPLIPKAREGEPEAYTLRDAQVEDIPLLMHMRDCQRAKSIVWSVIDERWWRYQIETWRTSQTEQNWHVQIIADATGTARGYVLTPIMRWGRYMQVWDMAFASEVTLPSALPSILRALQAQGTEMPAKPDAGPLTGISFFLGRTHPVYDALGDALAPSHTPPYAWYVRVGDLPAFLRHIAPALERRLVDSVAACYSGELMLDFCRSGLRMVFKEGRLTTVENWRQPTWWNETSAGFPPLVFLQLLFGYRSLDDLRYAFPDVWVKDELESVFKALFPTKPSWVTPKG